MTPTDRLIVALDLPPGDAADLVARLIRGAGVRFFKVGCAALLAPGGWDLVERLGGSRDVDLFLDLKLYDTRDTVARDAAVAWAIGTRFLTVHATPSMLEAAMRAKPFSDYTKVLAVDALTDQDAGVPRLDALVRGLDESDGAIMSSQILPLYSTVYGMRKGKIVVSPGIRLTNTSFDNHVRPFTPTEAVRAGADYLVVGRPIYLAPDPVAAALAVITEIEDASR